MKKCLFLVFYLFSPYLLWSQLPACDYSAVMQFLHNDKWHLTEICIEDSCYAIRKLELPFGINTKKYKDSTIIIGYWIENFDPVTFKSEIGRMSCPDFGILSTRRIDSTSCRFNIALSTPDGQCTGILTIKKQDEIEIVARRPSYEGLLITHKYKILEE